MGVLKAKLAKYRAQLLEPPKKAEKGDGFDVLKSGDARVALIGFPSVGKVRERKLFYILIFLFVLTINNVLLHKLTGSCICLLFQYA